MYKVLWKYLGIWPCVMVSSKIIKKKISFVYTQSKIYWIYGVYSLRRILRNIHWILTMHLKVSGKNSNEGEDSQKTIINNEYSVFVLNQLCWEHQRLKKMCSHIFWVIIYSKYQYKYIYIFIYIYIYVYIYIYYKKFWKSTERKKNKWKVMFAHMNYFHS